MELRLTNPADGTTNASLTITTPEGRIRLSGQVADIEKALAQAITNTGLPVLRRHGIYADRLPSASS